MNPRMIEEPKPGEERCDFCSAPDVQWSYPCRDHRTIDRGAMLSIHRDGSLGVQPVRLDAGSFGNWAACPACHALIERGDRDRLARRSAKRLLRGNPKLAAVLPLSEAIALVRHRHDDFWANREGPPTRAKKGPAHA